MRPVFKHLAMLFFFFMYSRAANSAISEVLVDSIKKYDRVGVVDPKCPCYKYQRRAEKEFRRELKKNRKRKRNAVLEIEKGKAAEEKQLKPLTKQSKWFTSRPKRKFAGSRKNKKTEKKRWFHKTISACSHW